MPAEIRVYLNRAPKGSPPIHDRPVAIRTKDGKPLGDRLDKSVGVSAGDLNGDGIFDLVYAPFAPACYDLIVYFGQREPTKQKEHVR